MESFWIYLLVIIGILVVGGLCCCYWSQVAAIFRRWEQDLMGPPKLVLSQQAVSTKRKSRVGSAVSSPSSDQEDKSDEPEKKKTKTSSTGSMAIPSSVKSTQRASSKGTSPIRTSSKGVSSKGTSSKETTSKGTTTKGPSSLMTSPSKASGAVTTSTTSSPSHSVRMKLKAKRSSSKAKSTESSKSGLLDAIIKPFKDFFWPVANGDQETKPRMPTPPVPALSPPLPPPTPPTRNMPQYQAASPTWPRPNVRQSPTRAYSPAVAVRVKRDRQADLVKHQQNLAKVTMKANEKAALKVQKKRMKQEIKAAKKAAKVQYKDKDTGFLKKLYKNKNPMKWKMFKGKKDGEVAYKVTQKAAQENTKLPAKPVKETVPLAQTPPTTTQKSVKNNPSPSSPQVTNKVSPAVQASTQKPGLWKKLNKYKNPKKWNVFKRSKKDGKEQSKEAQKALPDPKRSPTTSDKVSVPLAKKAPPGPTKSPTTSDKVSVPLAKKAPPGPTKSPTTSDKVSVPLAKKAPPGPTKSPTTPDKVSVPLAKKAPPDPKNSPTTSDKVLVPLAKKAPPDPKKPPATPVKETVPLAQTSPTQTQESVESVPSPSSPPVTDKTSPTVQASTEKPGFWKKLNKYKNPQKWNLFKTGNKDEQEPDKVAQNESKPTTKPKAVKNPTQVNNVKKPLKCVCRFHQTNLLMEIAQANSTQNVKVRLCQKHLNLGRPRPEFCSDCAILCKIYCSCEKFCDDCKVLGKNHANLPNWCCDDCKQIRELLKNVDAKPCAQHVHHPEASCGECQEFTTKLGWPRQLPPNDGPKKPCPISCPYHQGEAKFRLSNQEMKWLSLKPCPTHGKVSDGQTKMSCEGCLEMIRSQHKIFCTCHDLCKNCDVLIMNHPNLPRHCCNNCKELREYHKKVPNLKPCDKHMYHLDESCGYCREFIKLLIGGEKKQKMTNTTTSPSPSNQDAVRNHPSPPSPPQDRLNKKDEKAKKNEKGNKAKNVKGGKIAKGGMKLKGAKKGKDKTFSPSPPKQETVESDPGPSSPEETDKASRNHPSPPPPIELADSLPAPMPQETNRTQERPQKLDNKDEKGNKANNVKGNKMIKAGKIVKAKNKAKKGKDKTFPPSPPKQETVESDPSPSSPEETDKASSPSPSNQDAVRNHQSPPSPPSPPVSPPPPPPPVLPPPPPPPVSPPPPPPPVSPPPPPPPVSPPPPPPPVLPPPPPPPVSPPPPPPPVSPPPPPPPVSPPPPPPPVSPPPPPPPPKDRCIGPCAFHQTNLRQDPKMCQKFDVPLCEVHKPGDPEPESCRTCLVFAKLCTCNKICTKCNLLVKNHANLPNPCCPVCKARRSFHVTHPNVKLCPKHMYHLNERECDDCIPLHRAILEDANKVMQKVSRQEQPQGLDQTSCNDSKCKCYILITRHKQVQAKVKGPCPTHMYHTGKECKACQVFESDVHKAMKELVDSLAPPMPQETNRTRERRQKFYKNKKVKGGKKVDGEKIYSPSPPKQETVKNDPSPSFPQGTDKTFSPSPPKQDTVKNDPSPSSTQGTDKTFSPSPPKQDTVKNDPSPSSTQGTDKTVPFALEPPEIAPIKDACKNMCRLHEQYACPIHMFDGRKDCKACYKYVHFGGGPNLCTCDSMCTDCNLLVKNHPTRTKLCCEQCNEFWEKNQLAKAKPCETHSYHPVSESESPACDGCVRFTQALSVAIKDDKTKACDIVCPLHETIACDVHSYKADAKCPGCADYLKNQDKCRCGRFCVKCSIMVKHHSNRTKYCCDTCEDFLEQNKKAKVKMCEKHWNHPKKNRECKMCIKVLQALEIQLIVMALQQ